VDDIEVRNIRRGGFETILKVLKALNTKINFNVELLDQKVKIA